ncbi:diaminopimelate decarboxylase [Streptomyces sp. LP05-1]|uniref:Diaminopimelate decarboxylase n=1 Tax=Streptomyces pyxinae TaxID=2970734 RepID=A0ABT2CHJ6_9ACTN|nr:diaminopimelate decarboxylase [Streptomyces sp. LP05-1]MCS0636780.1 diaminopimelate decarboxylase [Streptomyces sp. LP05-1]
MTLTTAPPSGPPAPAGDLSHWPASTTRLPAGGLAVAGVPLTELAERFGTPAYVLDEGEVRARCRRYREAFPDGEVLYAAKAFLSRAMVRWVREEGLGLDVCSAGELHCAVTAGFPPERVLLHGNAKSPQDLRTALRLGVGRIVVDGLSEIARLAAAVSPGDRQRVLVRVIPGVAAGGHPKIRTGTEDQKFGLSAADGSAQEAIARILGQSRLELAGLHCHIGSQITEAEPYVVALRRMVGLLARVRDTHRVVLPQLDLGGGHGVAHRPGDPWLDPAALGTRLRAELAESCAAAGLPVPRLEVEPGRAVVGPAGVALYRVLAVKRTGERLFAAVDGGMSDNPRPALYGARYAPCLVGRASTAPEIPVTVAGRHCEAGDVLAAGVRLPGDLRPGDLLAVPVAGAYQLSMASGYNLVGRPPVVAVHEGAARLLVRRETADDLWSRDVGE